MLEGALVPSRFYQARQVSGEGPDQGQQLVLQVGGWAWGSPPYKNIISDRNCKEYDIYLCRSCRKLQPTTWQYDYLWSVLLGKSGVWSGADLDPKLRSIKECGMSTPCMKHQNQLKLSERCKDTIWTYFVLMSAVGLVQGAKRQTMAKLFPTLDWYTHPWCSSYSL